MANATAAKPDNAPTPKKRSPQPPADTIWLRYHPWMEGVVGHIASWAVHCFMIGIGVFLFMAPGCGWIPRNRQIPTETVMLADAGGGGDPNATGKDPSPAALPEGVHSDQNNAGDKNSSAPPIDRPILPADLAQKLEQGFTAPDNPGAATTTGSDLAKLIDDKLGRFTSRSQGAGGPGSGTGTGPGAGPGTGPGTGPGVKGGDLTEAEEEDLRWTINLTTRDGSDYLRQLAAIGALIAVPIGRDAYVVVDLRKRPLKFEEKTYQDLIDLKKTRFMLIDDKADSVDSLLKAMGYPGKAPQFDAFFPNEMRAELKQKELEYKHLTEAQIHQVATTFHLSWDAGGRYLITVMEQSPRQDTK
jgi:hypothetical protein